ncbi:MAG TPA: hypothetical protein VK659_02550 [Asanoa sp.]|nr:hypothetical protein [Asanoa sp.]
MAVPPPTRPASAVDAVRYGFGPVPAVLLVAALVIQRRYTLDRGSRA